MIARMMENPIEQMENWGYHLLPQFHPKCPGYEGLRVAIRERPTRRHFDPETIQLSLFSPGKPVQEESLNLLTPLHKPQIVCPGTVVLIDRRGKQESFYLLGGTIESASVPGEIVFTIRSTAPVLWLTKKGESICDQLAAELGALIAQVRATSGESDDEFFGRLASIEPLALYTAAIYTIFSDYEHQADVRESYPEVHSLLHEEQQWLQEKELWPAEPVTLAQLLGID